MSCNLLGHHMHVRGQLAGSRGTVENHLPSQILEARLPLRQSGFQSGRLMEVVVECVWIDLFRSLVPLSPESAAFVQVRDRDDDITQFTEPNETRHHRPLFSPITVLREQELPSKIRLPEGRCHRSGFLQPIGSPQSQRDDAVPDQTAPPHQPASAAHGFAVIVWIPQTNISRVAEGFGDPVMVDARFGVVRTPVREQDGGLGQKHLILDPSVVVESLSFGISPTPSSHASKEYKHLLGKRGLSGLHRPMYRDSSPEECPRHAECRKSESASTRTRIE